MKRFHENISLTLEEVTVYNMALPLLLRECLYVCMSVNISSAFNYAHEQITIGTPEYDGARTTINIIMI